MKVFKFGGTSVGSVSSILAVVEILKETLETEGKLVTVCSAVGGMTNKLIEMGELAASGDESYLTLCQEFEEIHYNIVREVIPVAEHSGVLAHIKERVNRLEDFLQGAFLTRELSKRTLDSILSFGEQLSCFLVARIAEQKGIKSSFVDARELIKTDSQFGNARVKFSATNENIKKVVEASDAQLLVVTGFIASDADGVTTTLGRGGSDYTASILGAALSAESVEIWTDVNGVMTADPRKVKNAFSLERITYDEAMEMSHFGAKVIYPPTLQPVFTQKIPILIRNTFEPSFEGTLISEKSGDVNKLRVKGISSIDDVSLVTVQGSGLIGVTGFSARLFGTLAQHQINIIMITQASSEHSISFAVAPGEGLRAQKVIETEFEVELEAQRLSPIEVIQELSVVAIIGENMTNTPGISGKMFSALGRNGVNIMAIAQGSSELNVSAVISKKDISKALNALHDEFFLSSSRTLNVFMIGPGLIGSALLSQIKDQFDYLVDKKSLNIRVVAIANSRKLLLDEAGIDLDNWKNLLEDSEESMSFDSFFQKMFDLNLPNSVFVDNTSNKELTKYYHDVLDNSVSIVTPNKVANSSELAVYKQLNQTAFKRGVSFLYETNVGAGLPVISTLQDLINSGDEILKIEGVFSGSLSFIFNTFDGSASFKDVVLMAKENGFTEPDPRDDLNGMDVARKILILAREAGCEIEPEDVSINNILPQSCIDASSVEDFFVELEKHDQVFVDLLKGAQEKGEKLRFVASLQDGKAEVSLKSFAADHPLFGLNGSDNMISFVTKRYEKNPLVIKGPGAGAEVTAAGVFADIIKTSNH